MQNLSWWNEIFPGLQCVVKHGLFKTHSSVIGTDIITKMVVPVLRSQYPEKI